MRFAGLLCAVWLAVLPVPVRAETVSIFAAASLRGVLDDIANKFTQHSGHRLRLTYAGSSTLARQIAFGAPADVVILANADWMDWLETSGHVVPTSRQILARNRLVFIGGPSQTPITLHRTLDLAGLVGSGHLAMALVEAVPAGIYGKAALEHFTLWDQIAPRVAQTDNVRAALALVALGQASHGVVYETDALADDQVRILATFPPESHQPIVYPAALVAGRDTLAASAAITYLQSDAARAMFADHGFGAPQ